MWVIPAASTGVGSTIQSISSGMPSTVGAGAAPAAATYGSSAASSYGSSYGGGSKPTKVERRGGVTYDPDQFDAENTVRFGRR